MITLARVKELIVDAPHEFIVALEAHLGIHPNRKPADPATAVEVPATRTQVEDYETRLASAVTHINGLEAKCDELDKSNAELTTKLDAANQLYEDTLAVSSENYAKLVAAQEQLAKLTAGQQAATEGKVDGEGQKQSEG